jgi:hypothetical protein
VIVMFCPLIKGDCKKTDCAWWVTESLVIEDCCALRILAEEARRSFKR